MEKEITSTGYQLPPLELLNEYATDGNVVPEEAIAGILSGIIPRYMMAKSGLFPEC